MLRHRSEFVKSSVCSRHLTRRSGRDFIELCYLLLGLFYDASLAMMFVITYLLHGAESILRS